LKGFYASPENFDENSHNLTEILFNFKKIISLFLLGFIIQGRPPHEDVRATFGILYKGFQLHNLLGAMKKILEKVVDHEFLLDHSIDLNHIQKELKELLLSLFKIFFFMVFAIDMANFDLKSASYLLKIMIILGLNLLEYDKFFRLPRIILYLLQLKCSSFGNNYITIFEPQTKAIIINKQ
jgi:hypothetical protein